MRNYLCVAPHTTQKHCCVGEKKERMNDNDLYVLYVLYDLFQINHDTLYRKNSLKTFYDIFIFLHTAIISTRLSSPLDYNLHLKQGARGL